MGSHVVYGEQLKKFIDDMINSSWKGLLMILRHVTVSTHRFPKTFEIESDNSEPTTSD